MNCNIVKDKILDYIDGNLSIEEMNTIKEHLNNCSECREEYTAMKSTIDYIKDNSKEIDTSRSLKLSPNKIKKRTVRTFTRTGLIAAILSILLVVTVFATDIFDFMKFWERSSEREITAWEELIENGIGQKLNISVTDKNIRVTAEGIIADDLNTIILLKIEDLSGNIRFTVSRGDNDEPRSFKIGGDIPRRREDIPPIVNYSPLYVEDENTVKLMIYTEPMSKDEGNVEIYLDKLMSMINENEESIVEVSGNWDMTIPAKKLESKLYEVNKSIDLDGNELFIRNIIIAPTTTRIDYSFDTFNEDNKHHIDSISFLIETANKTYGRSELSRGSEQYRSGGGFVRREFDIQSLYLEDLKDIDLIVNTYEYSIKDSQEYVIDWDRLPQTIEYNNSKIIIEDIKYNEDSTEITIKEDSSWNREYTDTFICLKIDEKRVMKDGEEEYSHIWDYYFNGTPIEYETRDSKGKVKDLENKFWSDEFYNFVYRQKITLSKDQFKRNDMDEDNFDQYLIPGTLYIEEQRYKEYPDIKMNINLGE